MSDNIQADEKIKIVDATLKMCIQRPNPALTMAHTKALEESTAMYPYMNSTIKIASIAEGEFSFSADNMFQEEVPSQLILGLVSSKAYSGDYKRSPFNFQHYDCNFVALYVDGQSLPTKPLQSQFNEGNYLSAYKTLQSVGSDVWTEQSMQMAILCMYLTSTRTLISMLKERRIAV